jgi:Fe-S cluster assembly protein SufD
MSLAVSERNITTEIIASVEKTLASEKSTAALRKEGLAHLQKLGLPSQKNEEYKHTPLTKLLEKNFAFSLPNAPDTAIDPTEFFIPGVTGNVLVFVNGKFAADYSRIDATQLTILPIREAFETAEREVVSQYVGKIADHSIDAFAAWNTAAWTDGVYISVPKNTIVSDPILIYHVHDVTAGQVVTALRNFVHVGINSEVTILEKFDSVGSSNGFSSVVSEGVIKENGGLNWYVIQNDSANRYQYELKTFQQDNTSRVNTYTFTLNGRAIRNNLQLSLEGQGIDSHMYGLYLVGKDTIADNHTVVDHKQPNSYSNELYKGVIDDSAKGVFNGKIYVRPNAQKTNAFQANKNILLTDRATVNTKPQLEIWADDVKCSHGCTTGQLDEEALFYLQTRGISKETARAMMLYAFAVELLETIKHESIKNYIDALISERLHKNF